MEKPSQKKILLVDDSSTVLMMHRLLLEGLQYELLFARDGREAVDKALTARPDLILLDVAMPGMSGLEVCQRLRERSETRSTPILMVTTRGERWDEQAGYQVGCTEYVTKPFDGGELLFKVRHYLGE